MKKAPRIVVGFLIQKDNKFLLVKEKLEDDKETWIIPGGGVDFGESLQDAVVREAKEELGLDIKIVNFIKFHEAIYPDYKYHTVVFFYKCKILKGQLKLEKGILEAKFFTKPQIKKLNLVTSAIWLKE